MKLLLIDADPTFARRLAAEIVATTAGVSRLIHARELEEGLALANSLNVTAVLLAAPHGDGMAEAACRQLMARWPHVPLLALAADAAEASDLELLAGGAADVLIKGRFTTAQLLQRIRIAVVRSRHHAAHPAYGLPHVAPRETSAAKKSQNTERPPASSVESSLVDVAPAPVTIEATARPLRILQVDGDDAYADVLRTGLETNMKMVCHVQRVVRLADALQRLVEESFDVIVVEPALSDSHGVETLATLQPLADEASIVVVTNDEGETLALESLKHGAQDCHFKGSLAAEDLARSIRMAVARKQPSATAFDPSRARISTEMARQGDAVEVHGAERRTQPRYLLTRSLIAVPVLPDGTPSGAFSLDGLTIDVSAQGVGFEVRGLERLPSQKLVVGIEATSGRLHFATLVTRWTEKVAGNVRVGGEFVAASDDLLRSELLLPRVNPQTHRFEVAMPAETLAEWTRLGVCHPYLVDRVLVCPDCKAVPSLRHGCRACGSVRTANNQMIHHFPCACVGPVSEFDSQGELRCPKCRQRNLIVGADFEYLDGPYQCLDCNWSDTEYELVGQCLACDLRFPIQQAVEEELIGYHVHRLDPLVLLAEHG